MRVAISGTHACGKSTLIDEFLLVHPEFTHEPEPYTVLDEDYGEVFAVEPSPDDFLRQLEFNIERLRIYEPGTRVIFERSPVDFLAYLLVLGDLGRGEGTRQLINRSLEKVRTAIQRLDLIVFLPLEDNDEIVSDSEDPELRSAVNSRLVDLFNNDDLIQSSPDYPVVVEALGSTAQRLRIVEKAVEAHSAKGKSG